MPAKFSQVRFFPYTSDMVGSSRLIVLLWGILFLFAMLLIVTLFTLLLLLNSRRDIGRLLKSSSSVYLSLSGKTITIKYAPPISLTKHLFLIRIVPHSPK